MFNSMFDVIKKVKFQECYNVKYFKEIKRLQNLLIPCSCKSRGVFRTQASIYDGALLWIYLTACYFCNKSSIIDVLLGHM